MGTVLGIKEDGGKQPVLVDEFGRVYVTGDAASPLIVTTASGTSLAVDTTSSAGIAKTSDVTQSVAVTTSSQNKALPTENGTYILQSRGCDTFIKTASGSGPTVTATAGGYSLIVFDGQTLTVRLEGDYIAWIGSGGGALVCTLVEAS